MVLDDRRVLYTALHGFADASSVTYGVAIYLRLVHEGGFTTTSLVTARPEFHCLKQLTIPKSELVTAHLLARLLVRVAKLLNIPFSNLYAWSDSEITLHWLAKSTSTLERFVANRVTIIQDKLPSSH